MVKVKVVIIDNYENLIPDFSSDDRMKRHLFCFNEKCFFPIANKRAISAISI